MLTPLNVLWPAKTIVAGESSFTMSFIHNSMSSMKLLSKKCDDAPKSDVMVNFSGPGVAQLMTNEWPMPEGGDSIAYGVGTAWEGTRAGGAATRVDAAVTGGAGAGAMTVGDEVPLAMTIV